MSAIDAFLYSDATFTNFGRFTSQPLDPPEPRDS